MRSKTIPKCPPTGRPRAGQPSVAIYNSRRRSEVARRVPVAPVRRCGCHATRAVDSRDRAVEEASHDPLSLRRTANDVTVAFRRSSLPRGTDPGRRSRAILSRHSIGLDAPSTQWTRASRFLRTADDVAQSQADRREALRRSERRRCFRCGRQTVSRWSARS